MNIFALDYCPVEAAKMQCDQHIRKMPIESCQLVQVCFDLSRLAQSDCPRTQKGTPRKHFNPKHPSAKWTKKTTGNLDWLIQHTDALFEEYKFRFQKRHFCQDFLDWAIKNLDEAIVPDGEQTEFAVAINEQSECRYCYKFDELDVVDKYRMYYLLDKPFAKWNKGRMAPKWYIQK